MATTHWRRRARLALYAAGAAAAAGVAWLLAGRNAVADTSLYARVTRGHFEVSVSVTGELQALRSETISGPSAQLRSRSVRITDVPIKNLVPEGTLVDSGDFVAQLDPQALSSQMKNLEDEVEKSLQNHLKVQLDTALTMRELRDMLANLHFEVEERRLVYQQSRYEPPATLRQAQINLQKAERSLRQMQENYALKARQARASMREAELNLRNVRRQREELLLLQELFTVRAPRQGMVIYYREWDGKKRTVGSKISPWDPVLATLPDLSELVSLTYVNEIDVSRIKVGQPVVVGVDAFPDLLYQGDVTEVANIGEQVKGSDAKVFEVRVLLRQTDSLLRPSMTTSNRIIVHRSADALYCPLECVHASDSAVYVYTASRERREVRLGEANDTHVIVQGGVGEGEKLYLSMPPRRESFRWVPLADR